MQRGQPPHRLRVLESFKEPRSTSNPYIAQLLAALREECDVECFTWRSALRGDYEVFHVHWPEVLLSGGRRSRAPLRKLAFAVLLARLRWRHITVVRTLHNIEPHEQQGRVDRRLLKELDKVTAGWILLNSDTPTEADACVAVVTHGHYRQWFRDVTRPEHDPRAMLFFGQVRRYKGVPELLAAFRGVADPSVTLEILGRPQDDALRTEIEVAADADPRVTVNLRHVPDDELAGAVGGSTVVVLPYAEMHNSGAVLLALSLDRPVLVPSNPVTDALADEVGAQWVMRYNGPVTAADLEHARQRAAALLSDGGRPDLAQRNWDKVAADHVSLFRRARSRGRKRLTG